MVFGLTKNSFLRLGPPFFGTNEHEGSVFRAGTLLYDEWLQSSVGYQIARIRDTSLIKSHVSYQVPLYTELCFG